MSPDPSDTAPAPSAEELWTLYEAAHKVLDAAADDCHDKRAVLIRSGLLRHAARGDAHPRRDDGSPLGPADRAAVAADRAARARREELFDAFAEARRAWQEAQFAEDAARFAADHAAALAALAGGGPAKGYYTAARFPAAILAETLGKLLCLNAGRYGDFGRPEDHLTSEDRDNIRAMLEKPGLIWGQDSTVEDLG